MRLTTLEAASEAAENRRWRSLAKFTKAPASTAAGIIAKLRFVLESLEDYTKDAEAMLASAILDLERLAEGTPARLGETD